MLQSFLAALVKPPVVQGTMTVMVVVDHLVNHEKCLPDSAEGFRFLKLIQFPPTRSCSKSTRTRRRNGVSMATQKFENNLDLEVTGIVIGADLRLVAVAETAEHHKIAVAEVDGEADLAHFLAVVQQDSSNNLRREDDWLMRGPISPRQTNVEERRSLPT
ncbi:hypothetical protein M9H77_34025 [Catharanthus roseus]|uniref:Uncharacterized protein n=1 Tax=Catharanthus roseus TaxID=4058 RepID=A0ACB9ZKB5_CATRO|nr:hypothetical protein M9H77_34025 [Catharanthus roseus]